MPSIRQIAKLTGREERTVKIILDRNNMTKDDPRAIDVCKKEAKDESPRSRKLTAEAAMKERENRIAQKLEDETYIEVETVERLMRIIVAKLEIIPTKLASEFNLDPKIVRRIMELHDECRVEMSKEIVGLKGLTI